MIINNSPKRRLPPSENQSLCNPNLKTANGCHNTLVEKENGDLSNSPSPNTTTTPAATAAISECCPNQTLSTGGNNLTTSPINNNINNNNNNNGFQSNLQNGNYPNETIIGINNNSMASSNVVSPGNVEEPVMLLSQSMESINNIHEGVRTLFVSGLPLDAKARELYLLFRGYKGFINAQLKSFSEKMGKIMHGYLSSTLKPAGKNGKLTAPVGFVTFETREQAEVAMADLKGVKFDPDGIQHMRLEFARSNTKVTKPKAPAMPISLGPLGIAGLMNNSMSGIPTVSSPTQYNSQHQSMLNHQQAMNLANFTATVNGNGLMTGFSPALFSHIPAFDPSLLGQNQDNPNNWAASLNPFELLSQAGLLNPTSLNSGANNNAPNSLSQQNINPAAFFQANNFNLAAQLAYGSQSFNNFHAQRSLPTHQQQQHASYSLNNPEQSNIPTINLIEMANNNSRINDNLSKDSN